WDRTAAASSGPAGCFGPWGMPTRCASTPSTCRRSSSPSTCWRRAGWPSGTAPTRSSRCTATSRATAVSRCATPRPATAGKTARSCPPPTRGSPGSPSASTSEPPSRRDAGMSETTTEYPALQVGLTPLETCQVLHDPAAKVPRTQAVVEIGVFRARTLLWLAAGAAAGKGARAVGVDTWDLRRGVRRGRNAYKRAETYRQAQDNVAASGLANVELIRGFSADVAAKWQGPRIGL